MEVRFLEVAESELDQAIEYYNCESPGQGDLFLVEALNAIERIKSFPEAWQSFTNSTRRCQLRRFPFGIIYQILDGEILIIAIANLHRRPDYWQERM
jgi:plasmid stabilization system protein ParE